MSGVLRSLAVLAAVSTVFVAPRAQEPGAPQTTTWRFDNLNSIGGYRTLVVGHPYLIDSPFGKAVAFNGVGDALFVDDHPLAGASTYTWDVIFRPDAGGAEAQRFFHLAEVDPKTGADTGNRMMFEIRIVKGQWCLDSFASSGEATQALLNCNDLHRFGKWYRVTAVYDGKMLRNYVDDEMEGQGPLRLTPQGQGHSSIGTRINRQDYFKGAVFEARFTPRALDPDKFLRMPAPQGDGSSN